MADRVPTVQSVSTGSIKSVREMNALKSEVVNLTPSLKDFIEKHPLPYTNKNLPPESGATKFGDRYETDEPRSKIADVRFEYMGNPNLEIPTKTLLAIAKEIDGSLRDIRAARLLLSDISENSNSRKDFLDWQKSQKN